MEACSVGVFLQDECNRTIYVKATESLQIAQLSSDQREILLWRTGINPDSAVSVCPHHFHVYFNRYEHHDHLACCDPLHSHGSRKKPTKGLRTVSLAFAKDIKTVVGMDIVPGKKLCTRCRLTLQENLSLTKKMKVTEEAGPSGMKKRRLNLEPGSDTETSDTGSSKDSAKESDMDISILESSLALEKEREKLNTTVETYDMTPVKTHSLPPHQVEVLGKNLIKKGKKKFSANVVKAFNLKTVKLTDSSDTAAEEEPCFPFLTIKQKAADFDAFIQMIKEKLPTLNTREKIQLLTLVPTSWPRQFVIDTFNVSQYMVRSSRTLLKEKGVLALPERGKGKPLSEETKTLIENFYQDEEYSRQLPGAKDFVSVARNVHKQKLLILCNLSELYSAFKQKNPNVKVGFSKFCSLRPKWCIIAGASGTHSVCVCTIHQNVDLLIHSQNFHKSSSELIEMMVCAKDSRECMLGQCDQCPGRREIDTFLHDHFQDDENEDLSDISVDFLQWVSVDRTQLIKQQLPANEFIELLINKLEKLIPHSFITKSQSRYLKFRKENLDTDTALLLMDFAENYTFVVQDEVQSYHWTHASCTLHPVVIYYRPTPDGTVCEKSLCFLSDDLEHDVPFVYKVQQEVATIIKSTIPTVKKVEYFTDGCAAQYKNCKSLLNLCHHKSDFGLDATWSFFATSHGKSPCDGIGGSAKRATTKASLQRPYAEQIVTPLQMFEYCSQTPSTVNFQFIPSSEIEVVRKTLEDRFKDAKTVVGTRSFHNFAPLSQSAIACKRVSVDENVALKFNFLDDELQITSLLKVNCYICCVYESKWYIALIQEINLEEGDVHVNFMHPHGPAQSFYWPTKEDTCYVPTSHILCIIDAPSTKTGRQYQINEKCKLILEKKWATFKV